ncbi:MAG: hypothetical protein ACOCVV_10495, partial [Marinobacter sp.]
GEGRPPGSPETEPGQEDRARQQADAGDGNDHARGQSPGADQASDGEEQADALSQSREQWLRRIPDDPGGLLRRKFLQQSLERNLQPDENDTPW